MPVQPSHHGAFVACARLFCGIRHGFSNHRSRGGAIESGQPNRAAPQLNVDTGNLGIAVEVSRQYPVTPVGQSTRLPSPLDVTQVGPVETENSAATLFSAGNLDHSTTWRPEVKASGLFLSKRIIYATYFSFIENDTKPQAKLYAIRSMKR